MPSSYRRLPKRHKTSGPVFFFRSHNLLFLRTPVLTLPSTVVPRRAVGPRGIAAGINALRGGPRLGIDVSWRRTERHRATVLIVNCFQV